jgi:hypothetical protein
LQGNFAAFWIAFHVIYTYIFYGICLEHIWPEPMGDSSQRSVGPPHMHRVQSTRLHRYQFSFVIVKEEGKGEDSGR